MQGKTIYFEKSGKRNTVTALEVVRERAGELGIKKVVLASTHGYTAIQAADVFKGTGIEIIAVSISAAFDDKGWNLTPEERDSMEKRGIKVLRSLHALADGVIEGHYGERTPGSIIADTLRCFSQGMKVAFEISIMAMEAGLILPDSEVIAIGGTDAGADTAIVVKPAFARKVKDFKICEILCKPRMA